MKQKVFTLLTLLLTVCSGAWAYEGASGDATFNTKINNSGRAIKVANGCYYYRPGSGYNFSEGNGVKTQSNASSAVFYLSGQTNVTIDVKHTESKNAHTVTASVYSLTESQYAAFYAITSETAVSFTLPPTPSTTFTVDVTATNTTFTGTKKLEGGYYAIVVVGEKGNTYFNGMHFTPAAPTITTQPVGASYVTGDPISPLTVAATASAGDLSYQWYSCDDAEKTNAAEIDGETNASYSPSAAGFYYVVVTDGNGSTTSNVVEITISAASAPSFTSVTPSATDIVRGTASTITAVVAGNPTPTIQWYKGATSTAAPATDEAIDGATDLTLNLANATVGTHYYYAVATNTTSQVNNVTSEVQTITINPKAPTIPASSKFETSKSVAIAKASGEDGAATIKYKEGDGEWQDYTTALNITSTKTITAKVVQSGLESVEVSATYTKFEGSELTAVSAATTWNFSNISANSSHAYYESNGIQLTGETFPTNTTTNFYVYEDFKGDFYTVNGGKTFDGTSIAFSEMQYPIRNNTYAQGNVLRIKTSVPGVIRVKFSNTGGSRPYRYLKVNETITEFRSATSSEVTSKGIYVPAGEVTLSGYIVNASDPQSRNGDVVGAAMLQFRQIEFEPLADADAVSVTDAGYATFVLSQDAYFGATDGVTAYAAKAAGTKITLTEVKAAPAGTPILLKAAEGNYTLKKATSIAPAAVSADINDLTAGPVTGDGASHYALGKEGGKVGFGLLADGVNLPATKAYIAASKFTSPAHFYSFDGETTGIVAVEAKKVENGVFYNLAGQQVAQPTKGLYIVNGRKVIVK